MFYILFIIGFLLSKKYRMKNSLFSVFYNNSINENTIYRVFNILYVICIGAYLIWFGNALMINGISIIINALSGLNNLAEYTNYLYLHSGRISGITTFTEFSTLASPLAVYLFMTNETKRIKKACQRKFLVLLLFCIVRAFLFSERVAIIEMFLLAFIVWLIYQKRINSRFVINIMPVFVVIALFIMFGVFEYARSWKAFYSSQYDLYFDFIYKRIVGYYCGSINTECVYLKHIGAVYWPHLTLNWLFRFPFFRNLRIID